MNAPDALPGMPLDAEGPVFAEPWQAQAFALAVQLNQQGAFTWTEWAESLAAELAAAGPADDPGRYYAHWLTALERLAGAKRLADSAALRARKEAWEAAYLLTPHGRAVTL